MSYPTLEQYNEALQHPATALTDPLLQRGIVSTTGLGLPLALCGGFALTYTITVGARKYAVRCFHKHSNALEQRYQAISTALRSLASPYFVDFEFQPSGVRVGGKTFPIVKMTWAAGHTLGEFVERSLGSAGDLDRLGASLRALGSFLERAPLAHGDVQPGNVMVSSSGSSIQLIDYDGIYVQGLQSIGSSELGHRNFQHPRRSASTWGQGLDRFSLIVISFALRVLKTNPALWGKTQSDGDAFLFKSLDFSDPGSSVLFHDLFALPAFAKEAKNLAAVCKSPFGSIPSLEDFLEGRNIPVIDIAIATRPAAPKNYVSTHPVIDARNYRQCLLHVGDRVELVGKIFQVRRGTTRDGRPYVFLNFSHWQGEAVKLSIWSNALSQFSENPDESWIGKWVSVVGLMEPPYRSAKYHYSHLSINITGASQVRSISEQEAVFRLSATGSSVDSPMRQSENAAVLDVMRNRNNASATSPTRTTPSSPNQTILQNMRNSQASSSTPAPKMSAAPQFAPKKPHGCSLLAAVIFVVLVVGATLGCLARFGG